MKFLVGTKVKKALLTKAEYWDYEKEYRIIFTNKARGVYKYPEDRLKGIIFGAKITDEHRETIMELLAGRKNPVQIYEAKIKDDEYGIEINEI